MSSSNNRAVRIIHIGPGGRCGRGGMGRFVLYVTETLTRTAPEFQVRVLDSYGPGRFYLMPFWFLGAALGVIRHALAWRTTVILHIHMASYGSAARKLALLLLGRAVGCHTVLHMHGADFVEFTAGLPRWVRPLLVAAMRRAGRVVVIGSFWQQYVLTALGLDPERVRLVHNGVPPPEQSAKSGSDSPCRILALGELGWRKGTPELLQALALLRDHPVSWQAVLAGNGPVEEYRRQVRALGLEERVQLPGWIEREAAQQQLAACHLFVLPSYLEGLPIAILEAMAMGRAIIATPVGAITDAIVHQQTGVIVQPGDVPALSAALRQLLESPALRQQLGKQAQAFFQQYFHIQRTAQLIIKIYEELLSIAHEKSP